MVNLIVGRRKRVQTRNTIRTRAAVLSPQYDITSPMKKEAKLHDSNVKNVNSDEIHSVSEAHKVPMCISSFFYTQVRNLFQIQIKHVNFSSECPIFWLKFIFTKNTC